MNKEILQKQAAIEYSHVTNIEDDINDFEKLYKKSNGEKLEIKQIYEVMNVKDMGKPVRILAHIDYITDNYPFTVSIDNYIHETTVFELRLVDDNGDKIKTFPIIYNYLGVDLRTMIRKQMPLIFTGTIIHQKTKKNLFYLFYVKSVSSNVTPLDHLRLRQQKKEYITGVFKKAASSKNGIRKYIKDSLIRNLGIKGIHKAPELNQALDFIILQSFSRGMSSDGRYSNKLHSLVIGSPAVGKKLLTKAALTLNYVGFELPSTSKKVTYAGLIGNVKDIGYSIISEPGYFPLASGGIICIQDYHELTKRKSNNLSDLFSLVMEDGKVIDSTKARTEHQAIISLHIDMNRLSHVNLSENYNSYADISIPLNVLSRFDFIIEIPPDLDRQLNVVSEMAKGSRILSTANLESETPQWQRDLKVIIAYVQTHFTMVEINERNNRYISSKLNNLFNKYTEDYERKILSSLATRIQISIEKLCKAIATSELRTVVTRDNINEAFEYVETKVDFLIEFRKSATPQLRAQTLDKKIERQNLILKFSTNEELSVPIIKDLLKGQGNTVNEKTIRRDLEELENSGKVEKIRQGRWKIANVQMSQCPSGAYKS